jgi:hypothetical protein
MLYSRSWAEVAQKAYDLGCHHRLMQPMSSSFEAHDAADNLNRYKQKGTSIILVWHLWRPDSKADHCTQEKKRNSFGGTQALAKMNDAVLHQTTAQWR